MLFCNDLGLYALIWSQQCGLIVVFFVHVCVNYILREA